jgi:hypothetical protein
MHRGNFLKKEAKRLYQKVIDSWTQHRGETGRLAAANLCTGLYQR